MEQAAVRMEAARMDAAFLSKQCTKMEEEQRYRQVRIWRMCCVGPGPGPGPGPGSSHCVRSLAEAFLPARKLATVPLCPDIAGANGNRQARQGLWGRPGWSWSV
jgi:hypothetical protein